MTQPALGRRGFLAGAASLAAGAATAAPSGRRASAPIPVNPLVRQRADAQVFRHTDGRYYMTGSVPEYDRLVLRRSPTLAGLHDAPERVLWRRPAQGKLGGYIWAPELHFVDGRWRMYFAAGDKDEPFHIRTYCISCDGPDPMTGRWTFTGQLQTLWDTFTLDSTSFVHRGTRYLMWAQKEPGIDTNSNLYIAPLATPLTFAKRPARLSVPTLEWEIQGFKVNEGPAVLQRHGKVFVTYSASATDARYCLGMLTAEAGADLTDPGVWSKSQTPVFTTNAATGVYGPGHNSFTVDEQGRDVLVYHGRDYREIKGDPLFDPNRHTRMQRIYYRPDGTPDFGVPVGNGEVPDRFSPLRRPDVFLTVAEGQASVGGGPLPQTQLRRRAAGGGTIWLEPILMRGQTLVRAGGGEVRTAPAGGAAGRFREQPGLADPRGVSFAAADGSGFLQVDGDRVRIGPARDPARATFRLS